MKILDDLIRSLKGDDFPIKSVHACVFYHSATLFDIVFPRILAGEVLTRREISLLGHGGFCMNCDPCHFSRCPFGKG